ncbi:MAG: hypothetical protein M1837_000070 [Sclerophora amabilis]|nr:MAG: hypothetical protein M1837_000070 [Sclerophora amabilis]
MYPSDYQMRPEIEDQEMSGHGLEDSYGQLFEQCVITDQLGSEESFKDSNLLYGVDHSVECRSPSGQDESAGTRLGLALKGAGQLDSDLPSQATDWPAFKAATLPSSEAHGDKSNFGRRTPGQKAVMSADELLSLNGAHQIKPFAPPQTPTFPSLSSIQSSSRNSTTSPSVKPKSHHSSAPHVGKRNTQNQSSSMMHPVQIRAESTPDLLKEWAPGLNQAASRYGFAGQSNGLPISPPPSAKLYGSDDRFPASTAGTQPYPAFPYSQVVSPHQNYSEAHPSLFTPHPSPNTTAHQTRRSSVQQQSPINNLSHARGSQSPPSSQPYSPWESGNSNEPMGYDFAEPSPHFVGGNQARDWWMTGSQEPGHSDTMPNFKNDSLHLASKNLMEMTGGMTRNEYGLGDNSNTSRSLATQGLMISCESREMNEYRDKEAEMFMGRLDNHNEQQTAEYYVQSSDYFAQSSSPSQSFYPTHSSNDATDVSHHVESLCLTPSTTPPDARLTRNLPYNRSQSLSVPHPQNSRPQSFHHSPSPSPTMRATKSRQPSRCQKSTPNSNRNSIAATIARARPDNLRTISSSSISSPLRAHRRTPSSSSASSGSSSSSQMQSGALSSSVGFVNYTPSDSRKILTGVAPSGSSKTKARREKEAREKSRRLSLAAIKAVQAAGGDIGIFASEGANDAFLM